MKIDRRIVFTTAAIVVSVSLGVTGAEPSQDWPIFRGPGGTGVQEGYALPTNWNAGLGESSESASANVLWQADVPGLGHSSPVVWGDRIYVCSAIAANGKAELMLGRGGQPTAADDGGIQKWVVLCYDKKTGQEIWRKVAREGVPGATRHAKATQANTSVAVDGENVVAFFGSEGLYCYDLNGNLKWKRDLGVVNISKYGIGWGYASSPAIGGGRIALACDDPENPYLVVLDLKDGKELWRVSRKGICDRSWGTPLIYDGQVVVNGWPYVVSYDLATSKELWRIKGGGDNPIPTPFVSGGHIYIASAHGKDSPIYVVKPDARGDITPNKNGTSSGILWSVMRGGSYMSTPVVYRGYIYLGGSSIIRCFNATTGEKIYENRLETGASIIASLVAGDGKIYCTSEHGKVYVLKAGEEFEVIASNEMGEPCFATPAISEGAMYFRTTGSLVAVK